VNPAFLTRLDATELMDVTPIMYTERVSQYVDCQVTKHISTLAQKGRSLAMLIVLATQ